MKENLHEIQQAARAAAHAILTNGLEAFTNEVVSHTVLAYHKTFGEKMKPDNLHAWATKVARNKASNIIRTEKRFAKYVVCNSELTDAVSGLEENFEFLTPALLLSRKEHVEGLLCLLRYTEDAVGSLEDSDRDLYRLIFKQRLTFDDAAVLMGEKSNTLVKRFPLLLKKVSAEVHLRLTEDHFCAEVFGVLQLSAEEWTPLFVQLLKDIRTVV
jgi:DNA-directed RNA polymerase specialized sigma24 family protein